MPTTRTRGHGAHRERALARLGYRRVLRIEAQLMLRDLPAAVALIREVLAW